MMKFEFTLTGQIPSGKNAVKINPRTGGHYPDKRFKLWREDATHQLMQQNAQTGGNPYFNKPCVVHVGYWAGDKRRRDVPGMMDALCHLLEHCCIVEDDSLLEDWHWLKMHVSTQSPQVKMIIEEKGQ